jgi:hypothetical protein
VGLGSLFLCWVVGVPLLRKHIARKFAEDIALDMNPFDEGSEENAALAANVKHYGTSDPANNERYDEDVVEEVAEEMEKNFSEYTAKEFSVWHCCGAQGTVLEHHERKNEEMYSNSETFDAKTEELFSFLQILTASVGGMYPRRRAYGRDHSPNRLLALIRFRSWRQRCVECYRSARGDRIGLPAR